MNTIELENKIGDESLLKLQRAFTGETGLETDVLRREIDNAAFKMFEFLTEDLISFGDRCKFLDLILEIEPDAVAVVETVKERKALEREGYKAKTLIGIKGFNGEFTPVLMGDIHYASVFPESFTGQGKTYGFHLKERTGLVNAHEVFETEKYVEVTAENYDKTRNMVPDDFFVDFGKCYRELKGYAMISRSDIEKISGAVSEGSIDVDTLRLIFEGITGFYKREEQRIRTESYERKYKGKKRPLIDEDLEEEIFDIYTGEENKAVYLMGLIKRLLEDYEHSPVEDRLENEGLDDIVMALRVINDFYDYNVDQTFNVLEIDNENDYSRYQKEMAQRYKSFYEDLRRQRIAKNESKITESNKSFIEILKTESEDETEMAEIASLYRSLIGEPEFFAFLDKAEDGPDLLVRCKDLLLRILFTPGYKKLPVNNKLMQEVFNTVYENRKVIRGENGSE